VCLPQTGGSYSMFCVYHKREGATVCSRDYVCLFYLELLTFSLLSYFFSSLGDPHCISYPAGHVKLYKGRATILELCTVANRHTAIDIEVVSNVHELHTNKRASNKQSSATFWHQLCLYEQETYWISSCITLSQICQLREFARSHSDEHLVQFMGS
jgi:hypothetical protein